MRRRLAIVLTLSLLLLSPSQLVAKGKTVKIVVQGDSLTRPVEISDPRTLANFQVWTGPGTSSNQAQSLIVDWSQGAIRELPKVLPYYQVRFYVEDPNERLAYVVIYAFDASTGHGFVYIPGKSDSYFEENVGSIFRGLEGNWFRAWSVWENVAGPLITKARLANGAISRTGIRESLL